jgi:DNA-binding XRE family transcriptional regulator
MSTLLSVLNGKEYRKKLVSQREVSYIPNHILQLKERRKKLGLTQTQLSAIIGYSEFTICHWEKGRVWPSRYALKDWCDALNVELVLNVKKTTTK